jgi:hypothetical protein
LYAEICDVLLGRREEAKNITQTLSAIQKKSVLQVLALELMKRQIRDFTLEFGGMVVQKFLENVEASHLNSEFFLRQIENLSGLLVERERGVYQFAHKSFQEYLAAAQVKESNQENILTSNINVSWWDETIRLYAAQSDATNLIQAALAKPSINSLKLAYDCQEESLSVQSEARNRLKAVIERGLISSNQSFAKLAAEVKIAQRISKLVRIDNDLEIELDKTLITCAEYQLFIDEKLRFGKSYLPDHWVRPRFNLKDATSPVMGIQPEDAEAFCKWLTERESTQDFQYRLPKDEEVEPNPILSELVGYWYKVGNRVSILKTVSEKSWRFLKEKSISLILEQENLVYDPNLDSPLKYTRLIRNSNHIFFSTTIESVCNLIREFDSNLIGCLSYSFENDLNINLSLELRVVLSIARGLAQDFNAYVYEFRGIIQDLQGLKSELSKYSSDKKSVLKKKSVLDLTSDLGIDLHNLDTNPDLNFELARVLISDLFHDLSLCISFTNNLELEKIFPNYVDISDLKLPLDRADFSKKSHNISLLRDCLFSLFALYNILFISYDMMSKIQKVRHKFKYTQQNTNALKSEFFEKREAAFKNYILFVLLDERQTGSLSAWEGIRIVRERVLAD